MELIVFRYPYSPETMVQVESPSRRGLRTGLFESEKTNKRLGKFIYKKIRSKRSTRVVLPMRLNGPDGNHLRLQVNW